jgi:hypothetical protein
MMQSLVPVRLTKIRLKNDQAIKDGRYEPCMSQYKRETKKIMPYGARLHDSI